MRGTKWMVGIILFASVSTLIGVTKSVRGENQLEKLTFLGIESLADGEGGGSDYREATPHDCNYSKDVFLEGADHIINVTVPGKKGICDGTSGTCNSWPCREVK